MELAAALEVANKATSTLSNLKGALSAFLDDDEDDDDIRELRDEDDDEIPFGATSANIGACTPDNLPISIRYINQTLDIYGYPSPLPLSGLSPEAAIPIINCINCLLQQRQKDIDFQYEQNETKRRVEMDKEQLQSKVEFLNERLISAERDYRSSLARERASEEKFKATRQRWEREKEELSKQIVQLQHRDTQYLHEIRKKEREYEKMKVKLQTALTGERPRSDSKGVGTVIDTSKMMTASSSTASSAASRDAASRRMSMFNKPNMTPQQAAAAPVNNQQEMIYKNVVKRYEDQAEILLAENEELRICLKNLYQTVKTLLPTQATEQSFSEPSEQSIIDGRFELPVHMMKRQIDDISNAIDLLKTHVEATIQESQSKIHNSAATAELQQQLEQYKKVIAEQEQMIQYSLSAQASMTREGFMDESLIESWKREFEDERALFDIKRKHLEEERKVISEMSAQLAKDKAELEQQKRLLLQLVASSEFNTSQ